VFCTALDLDQLRFLKTFAQILPGFGGSLGMLALGLLGRHFANRIAEERVKDHCTAANVNR
jgi:hypothetical protein